MQSGKQLPTLMLPEVLRNQKNSIYPPRRTLVSGGFKRVNKKRPCRICGKATYCGFSSDEGTSICMRVSAGARGPSRNGGNKHVHTEIPIITFPPAITIPNRESIPLAPLEIRDAGFQELIRMSPASNYREELVTDPRRFTFTRTPRRASNQVRCTASHKKRTLKSRGGS